MIGDEILKGLVRDSNSYFLAQHLWQLGVKVNKVVITAPFMADILCTKCYSLFGSIIFLQLS